MITLASVAEETSGLSPDPIDGVRAVQRYATGTKNDVGMGSMVGSGAAAAKPGPAYIARGFHSISSSVSSMSLLPVLLLSPSSSALVCGGRCFLCTSQRSADDAQLIVHVLLTRGDVLDDDDEAGLAAFLCASHLSTGFAYLYLTL